MSFTQFAFKYTEIREREDEQLRLKFEENQRKLAEIEEGFKNIVVEEEKIRTKLQRSEKEKRKNLTKLRDLNAQANPNVEELRKKDELIKKLQDQTLQEQKEKEQLLYMAEERHKREILYNEEKESLRDLGHHITESEFSIKRLLDNLQELRKT